MGKRLQPNENITKLREFEVRLARGETAAQDACDRANLLPLTHRILPPV